ncbi:MAG: hypothetical protein R6U44_10090 [Archaeoglobaceae archaeon]
MRKSVINGTKLRFRENVGVSWLKQGILLFLVILMLISNFMCVNGQEAENKSVSEASKEITDLVGLREVKGEIGDEVPTFGGLYVDHGNSTIHVYVMSQEDAEKIREVVSSYEDVELVIHRGNYTFSQLMEWKSDLTKPFLGNNREDFNVTLVGIDERKNKLVVGVETAEESQIKAVKKEIKKLNIPQEAVDIIEVGPYQPLEGKPPGVFEVGAARGAIRDLVGLREVKGEIGDEVPTFGGLFVDRENSTIYVYVKSQEDAEKIKEVVSHYEDVELVILKGNYTFSQLMEWKGKLIKLFSDDDLKVTSVDIEDTKNKLEVGVETAEESQIKAVKKEIKKLNIPQEAVDIIEEGSLHVGEAKSTGGFEVISAIAGLLVVYLLRGR